MNQVEDDDRIEFMDMHIAAVLKAKEGGCDVRGYYAWSPFDLYSWKTELRSAMVWLPLIMKTAWSGDRKKLLLVQGCN